MYRAGSPAPWIDWPALSGAVVEATVPGSRVASGSVAGRVATGESVPAVDLSRQTASATSHGSLPAIHRADLSILQVRPFVANAGSFGSRLAGPEPSRPPAS